MAEPTNADLVKLIERMNTSLTNLSGNVHRRHQALGRRVRATVIIMVIAHLDSRSWISQSMTGSQIR